MTEELRSQMGWWDNPENSNCRQLLASLGCERQREKWLLAGHEGRGFQQEWSNKRGCLKWSGGGRTEGKERDALLFLPILYFLLAELPGSQRAGELGKIAPCNKGRTGNVLKVHKMSWDSILAL